MRVYVHAPPPLVEPILDALAGHDVVNDPRAARPAPLAQTERQHFIREVDRLLEADALVADASDPSGDVGWMAAWFLAKGRLVVLTCRRDARAALAPMLAGNPSPWQRLVTYDDAAALRRALADALGSR